MAKKKAPKSTDNKPSSSARRVRADKIIKDDFMREVDEALTADRAKALWAEYGTFIIACVIAVVVGVALNLGYQAYQQGQREKASLVYERAMNELKADNLQGGVVSLSQLEGNSPAGYEALSSLLKANTLAQQGKFREAVSAYDVAQDNATDSYYKSMAVILSGYVQVAHPDVADAIPFERTQRQLSSLADDSKNVWAPQAMEVLAIHAYAQGDSAQAAQYYAKIAASQFATPTLASRAEQMISVLGGQ